MAKAQLFTLLCVVLWTGSVSAADLNLDRNLRPQIRNQIRSCQTMLVTRDQDDDSVGIPFSTHSPEDFAEQLKSALHTHGIDKISGGTFYVLGVAMQDEEETRRQYEAVLLELGLVKQVKLQVLSVPAHLIEQESNVIAAQAWERTRYFFPSMSRDYQSPQLAEVSAGWITAAAIEIPNVYFLFQSLPAVDATATITTHAAVLGAYLIYSKSMLNWLLREGSRQKIVNELEIFLKQMLLSVPFVANYQIFGNLTNIVEFLRTHAWPEVSSALLAQSGHFFATQSLTLLIQTLFYSHVITRGFGGWVDQQVGERNSRLSRALRPWLQTPVLAVNAVLLAMASNYGQVLLDLGALQVNSGQVGIAGMLAAGALFFKLFPRALDRTLPVYERLEGRIKQMKKWYFEPSYGLQSALFKRYPEGATPQIESHD